MYKLCTSASNCSLEMLFPTNTWRNGRRSWAYLHIGPAVTIVFPSRPVLFVSPFVGVRPIICKTTILVWPFKADTSLINSSNQKLWKVKQHLPKRALNPHYFYHKIYIFVQHIYNFLQSIHRLHVSALLGHHQALYMNRFLILVHFGIPNCYKDVIKILCAT